MSMKLSGNIWEEFRKKSFFQRLDKPSLDHLKHSNNGCFVIISVMVLSPCKLSTLTNASTSLKTHLTTGEYITHTTHTSIHQVSLPLLSDELVHCNSFKTSYVFVFFLQRQQQKTSCALWKMLTLNDTLWLALHNNNQKNR